MYVVYEQPNAFTFTDVTGQPLSTIVASAAVTITGLTVAAAVSLTATTSGSEWSKNGGTWGTAAGTVINGDTVQVRHNTGGAFSATSNTTISIAGISDTFSTTTIAADTTPDAFTFTAVNNVNLSTVNASNVITVSGINTASNISITGGDYSKNGGAYTTAAGTVNNGDTVQVRGTASASYNTAVNVVLTIGGVSGTYTITTRVADTTPDAFSFTAVSGAVASTLYTSNAPTITGIEIAANVTFSSSGGSGQQYSINGGAWTALGATTISNGQTIAVRQTTSATVGATSSITVTIGGVVGTYSVVNANDSTPDAFTFTAVTAANNLGGVVYTSNAPAITGIDIPSNVTFTNSNGTAHQYSINGGAWTNIGATTITVGQTIAVRLTNTAGSGVVSSITVTIGGVVGTYSVTNAVGDTTPDAFTFIDNAAAPTGIVVQSNLITITGIDTASSVSFSTAGSGSAHQYQKNGGAWTNVAADTVVLNDTLRVRLTPGGIDSTADITMTVGGVADTFNTTSVATDSVPNAFSFVDQSGVAPFTVTASAAITVSGINIPSAISVSGADGQYQVNSGGWTSTPGTVVNGDQVQARLTSAVQFTTQTNVVVTIGGISDTFSVTTRAPAGVNQYVKTFRELAFGVAA